MTKSAIDEFAKSQGYIGAEYLKKWKGFDCYEPVFSDNNDVSYVGLPLVILVKGNSIRMSTPDEAMKI